MKIQILWEADICLTDVSNTFPKENVFVKTNLRGPWEFAYMKPMQTLVLQDSEAVEGGVLPGRYQTTCQLLGAAP